MDDVVAILDAALAGDRRALARAITWIELRDPAIGEALARRARAFGMEILDWTGPASGTVPVAITTSSLTASSPSPWRSRTHTR